MYNTVSIVYNTIHLKVAKSVDLKSSHHKRKHCHYEFMDVLTKITMVINH